MDALSPGAIVDERFELLEVAGRGGMGVVYRAHDRRTDRPVALKVTQRESDVDRFLREGRVLAELDHPAVVRLVAHGTLADGGPYLAMEWLDGVDLRERLSRRGLTIAETLALARRVLSGLEAAHGVGVVHRDIKPSNLWLVDDDAARACLLDFGIARAHLGAPLTWAGAPLGTPGYMAPEQARAADRADGRADLFALGCVLFECLTGAPPYVAADPFAVLAKILASEPPRLTARRPDIDPALDALVAQMMAREPDDRPADAATVRERLASVDPGTDDRPRVSDVGAPALSTEERRLVSLVLAIPSRGEARAPQSDVTLVPVTVRDETPRPGEELYRVMGGALIASFSGASTARARAARAAERALALRDELSDMSIVVATGPGSLDGRLASGEVLDIADGLLAQASSGAAIAIDPITHGLLVDAFDVARDADGAWLRGRARSGAARVSGIVGRRRERGALTNAYEATVEDELAACVLVIGEPGIGKSRLIEELESSVAGEARVIRAFHEEGAMGAPLGTIRTLLRAAADGPRALAAELDGADAAVTAAFLAELAGWPVDGEEPRLAAARMDPAIMREQLRRAFEEWIVAAASRGPLVLSLDDLQWSDGASVALLDGALRVAAERPLLVVATARPEVDERFPDLWAARGVQRIGLAPLRPRACRAFVAEALPDASDDDVARIVDRSAGNPLYLEELVRAAARGEALGSSDTVIAMLQARLEALDAQARQVLRAAAVFGERFWVRGVAHLLGGRVPPDEIAHLLEALTSRELVVPVREPAYDGETELRFAHALIRQAAASMLEPDDRALGHRLAAAWLERAGEPSALVLARHLEAGGELDAAAVRFVDASEAALARGDVAGALAHAAHARPRVTDPAARAHLDRLRTAAFNATGAYREVADAAAEVLARAAGESEDWWTAAGYRVEALGRLGDRDAVLETVAAMVAAPDPTEPMAGVTALCRAAFGAFFVEQEAGVQTLLSRLDRVIAPVADQPMAIGWREMLESYRALRRGDLGAYLRHCQRSAEAHGQSGDLQARCRQLANVGTALLLLGAWDEAREALAAAKAAGERVGNAMAVAYAPFGIGHAALEQGEPAEAATLLPEAVESFTAMGDLRAGAQARAYLALAHAQLGDDARARVEAERALADGSQHPHVRARITAVLADIHLLAGRHEAALARAEEAVAQRDALGALEADDALVDRVHADALRAAGRDDEADAARARGRARVLERADRIEDPARRESYLRAVRAHSALVQADG